MSALADAWMHPASSGLVMSAIALFVASSTNYRGMSARSFGYSYKDAFFDHRALFKVIGGGLGSFDPKHLLLSITSFWCARGLETYLGSLLFLQYSLVLILASAVMKIGLVACLRWYASRYPLMAERVSLTLDVQLPAGGLMELTFAWLIFGGLTRDLLHASYWVLGFVPVAYPLAPLALMLVCQFILPPKKSLANVTAMLAGVLLYMGPLRVVPSAYWSATFTATLLLYTAHVLLSRFPAVVGGNDDDAPVVDGIRRCVIHVPVFVDATDDDNDDGGGSGGGESGMGVTADRGTELLPFAALSDGDSNLSYRGSYQHGHSRPFHHQQHQHQPDIPDEEMGLLSPRRDESDDSFSD